jgi:(E)-4-hydroxy-3-methylbut-2-enyl-diphosphate synthase
VVGCIVNGPGEAKVADIGLTGATPVNMSYINGETHHKISNENLVDELEAMIRQKVREKEQAQNNEKSQA